jgi:hypothetical protein
MALVSSLLSAINRVKGPAASISEAAIVMSLMLPISSALGAIQPARWFRELDRSLEG